MTPVTGGLAPLKTCCEAMDPERKRGVQHWWQEAPLGPLPGCHDRVAPMGKQCSRPQESRVESPDIDHGATAQTQQQALQPLQVQDTLQKILEAIENSKNTLRQEIGKVSVELGLLRTDHRKTGEESRQCRGRAD
ncbi:hypothetical protein NDU88_000833 [Pleurodeles waltl]|uniref:Uncharacterized protein n=1 Tax=Pleurodeles waltl TaxID=8319 RepID=A0AAV7VUN0_PLEWA|nr:hypothetical protein NDU88_000833 [Pleurodeles waltl]